MAVLTYTEYLEREHAFFVGVQVIYDDANTEHEKCLDDAQKKHDQTMNALATVHPTTAAEAQALADAKKDADDLLIEEKAECDNQRADKIEAASNGYRQDLEDLQKEAAESLARVERLIITHAELQPAAVALQNMNWYTNSTAATRAPILTVSSLDDLRHELEADRGMFELLLLVRAANGELVFGTDRRSISDITSDIQISPEKLTVLETVHLRGELVGAAPDDTDSLSILGTSNILANWSVQVPPVTVEIQVNNTPSESDDVVLLKCAHPSKRVPVPCRIELKSKSGPSPVTVVLHDPNDRIRFPNAATKTVTLSHVGDTVPFQISGHVSDPIGDTVIEARVDSLAGPVCGKQPVTVVNFTHAEMTLTPGTHPYKFKPPSPRYTTWGDAAMWFQASATIYPSKSIDGRGVDCTEPQLTSLRVGIMQESSNYIITKTWDNPTITWDKAALKAAHVPKDTDVTVPSSVRETIKYGPLVTQPVNDGSDPLSGSFPLYANGTAALKTPLGCSGVTGAASTPATSNDAPGQDVTEFRTQDVILSGTVVGTTIWSRAYTTRREKFRTFCVIFDTSKLLGADGQFCALQQAEWELNVDSRTGHQDLATVTSNNTGATANPAASLPDANHAATSTTPEHFGHKTFKTPDPT